MPFAPTVSPDLGTQIIAQGAARAAQSIGQGVEGLVEGLMNKAKERKNYLGIADAMRENGEMTDQEIFSLQNADTETIKGYVDGKKVAAALTKLKQDTAEQQARTALYTQETADKAAELTNARIQPEFMTAMDRYLSPSGNYEDAAQTPEGRAAMIAGSVTPGPMPPLRAVARAARQTGYTVRPGQLDDILRAVKYGQTPALPEGFTPTKVNIGGVTYEPPVAPAQVPPGFTPTQIVVGSDGKPRYTLEPAPPPVVIPANMQPRTVTLDTKGRPTVTYAEPDAAKKLAADYPWLLDDDVEKFKTGLRAIPDPAERNAVIETRNRYEQALGRPSLLERFLTGDIAPTKPAGKPDQAAPKTTTAKQPAQSGVALPAGRVRVISPAGKIGNIPAEQLDEALKNGYRQLQ